MQSHGSHEYTNEKQAWLKEKYHFKSWWYCAEQVTHVTIYGYTLRKQLFKKNDFFYIDERIEGNCYFFFQCT